MGWERYLLHDFFTARELNELDERLEQRRRMDQERRMTTNARLAEIEDSLGRVALLARALADVCLSKGLLSREELASMVLKVDLADGKQDGRLDARGVMPGETQPAAPEPKRDQASRSKRRRPYP